MKGSGIGAKWKERVLNLVLLAVLPVSSLAYAEADSGPVWIDVRTVFEHAIDRIDGDIRISWGDIVEGVTELFPDKETEIHLYCRSGARSSRALAALKAYGYNNVFNAGGIGDARKQRGLAD